MATDSHWAAAYIGQPWQRGTMDCWAFFRRVQADHYGRQVPACGSPDSRDLLAVARALRDDPERQIWRQVDAPRDGDAVLMGKGRHPTHIGVWIEADGGGVLHSQQHSGVIFTRLPALRALGWQLIEFYRKP
jgi:hypothetical protein